LPKVRGGKEKKKKKKKKTGSRPCHYNARGRTYVYFMYLRACVRA
jgi:hypothetical protein